MIVSLIIVARDAASSLPNLFDDILNQVYDKKKIQLIFVDSMSCDDTFGMFRNFKNCHNEEFLSVVLKKNPKKILPCGCNIALKEVVGDLVVRVDAHSRIESDFISNNVLLHERGKFITGGTTRNISDGESSYKKLILFLDDSLFGSGIARFRSSKKSEYVSTLAYAMYDVCVFRDVGGYDERLARTEDNEIHYRMRKKGYKFFLSGNICSYHYVRGNLSSMLKQKFLNGKWIGLTLGISPKCFSVYHFVPFLFVISILFSLVALLFSIKFPILILGTSYLMADLLMFIFSLKGTKFEFIYLLSPILFFCLHIFYGFGTLVGLIILPFWKSKSENHKCDEIENIKRIFEKQSIDSERMLN